MSRYFTTTRTGEIVAIRFLFSELSLEEAEEFKDEFYAVANGPEKKFVVNMEKCVFIPYP